MLRSLLLSLVCISSLLAHKINLFAYDESGQLMIQSYFTKTSPCKECTISLVDANENVLVQLRTNDEGKVSTPLPAKSFFIIVDAGMGHQHKIQYEAQSHTKEETKNLPSDTPIEKIVLGLGIIALLFGGMYWIKRRKRT